MIQALKFDTFAPAAHKLPKIAIVMVFREHFTYLNSEN